MSDIGDLADIHRHLCARADADVAIRRDVGGIDRAERRDQCETAGERLAARLGVAGCAIGEPVEVFAAGNVALALRDRGRESRIACVDGDHQSRGRRYGNYISVIGQGLRTICPGSYGLKTDVIKYAPAALTIQSQPLSIGSTRAIHGAWRCRVFAQ
jgi:hypothetical protein